MARSGYQLLKYPGIDLNLKIQIHLYEYISVVIEPDTNRENHYLTARKKKRACKEISVCVGVLLIIFLIIILIALNMILLCQVTSSKLSKDVYLMNFFTGSGEKFRDDIKQ